MTMQPGFSDSRIIPQGDDGTVTVGTPADAKGMSKTPPPMYAVLRAGSTTPEPLRAENDEEAMATVKRQVRTGQIPVVYLYRMVCAEVFEPTSNTLSLDELKESKFHTGNGNIPT